MDLVYVVLSVKGLSLQHKESRVTTKDEAVSDHGSPPPLPKLLPKPSRAEDSGTAASSSDRHNVHNSAGLYILSPIKYLFQITGF